MSEGLPASQELNPSAKNAIPFDYTLSRTTIFDLHV